jgi:hypothetical protein
MNYCFNHNTLFVKYQPATPLNSFLPFTAPSTSNRPKSLSNSVMSHGAEIGVDAVLAACATFTEKDVNSQGGCVFIVTGGNQDVGLELIKMPYPASAVIYMASGSRN